MSDQGRPPSTDDAHEPYQILMMGYLDGEVSGEEEARLRRHLEECRACSTELVRYRRLADLAAAVKLKEPKDFEWDRFQRELYSRFERRGAWLLILAGTLLIGALGVYALCTSSWPLPLRTGIGLTAAGLLLLFLHVLRGRLRILPYDRYREVQR